MKQAKRILRIGIARLPDDDPDTSWLGEYSSKRTSEFSIDRAHNEDCATQHAEESQGHITRATDYLRAQWDSLPHDSEEYLALDDALDILGFASDAVEECDCGHYWDRHTYRFFNPSFNYIDAQGNTLPEYTPEDVRKYVAQDYARMEALNNGQWEFIGIRACADVTIGNTRQSIYSGGLWGIESDSEASYLKEVESEELASLRETLYELGFSKRAIATAVKERMDA
jgi:hypothetical protein